MTEKRTRGYDPRLGLQIARTWATAYGSAWMLSSDLIEFPGLFTQFTSFQQLERALIRGKIFLERMPFDSKAFLYRLSPETVAELTYGGADGDVRTEGP